MPASWHKKDKIKKYRGPIVLFCYKSFVYPLNTLTYMYMYNLEKLRCNDQEQKWWKSKTQNPTWCNKLVQVSINHEKLLYGVFILQKLFLIFAIFEGKKKMCNQPCSPPLQSNYNWNTCTCTCSVYTCILCTLNIIKGIITNHQVHVSPPPPPHMYLGSLPMVYGV